MSESRRGSRVWSRVFEKTLAYNIAILSRNVYETPQSKGNGHLFSTHV